MIRTGLLRILGIGLVIAVMGIGCGKSAKNEHSGGDATATFAAIAADLRAERQATATQIASQRTVTPVATSTPTVEPTQTPSPDTTRLLALLPTSEVLPNGFVLAQEGPISAEEIAATYRPDDQGLLERLAGWGFKHGVFRDFGHTDLEDIDLATQFFALRSAIIEYGSPEQAVDAMMFERNYYLMLKQADITDVSIQKIGDQSLALQGTVTSDDKTEYTLSLLWLQRGTEVLSFGATSFGCDCVPDLATLAQGGSLAREVS